VLRALVTSLAQRYAAWSRSADDSGLLADYRSRCDTIGRDVRVELPHGDPLVGRAVGVADDGALLVRPGGAGDPVAVHAGDVVHVRPVP
jgi:BirA family biotin operon repressor/biotin-[acetyl-CoA-carboxylase] ligase